MDHLHHHFLGSDEAVELLGQLESLMHETGHFDPAIDTHEVYRLITWPQGNRALGHGVAVTVADGQIVAATFLEVVGHWGMLWRVAVSPRYQHQGRAAELLGFVLETLRYNDIHQIQLFCRNDNEHALSLYRSLGFQPQLGCHQLLVHSLDAT